MLAPQTGHFSKYYPDIWYYTCKNRKLVSGHLCDYKKHVRQDELNVEVIQLVKYVFGGENDMKDQILQKLDSDDSLRELLAEKERLHRCPDTNFLFLHV